MKEIKCLNGLRGLMALNVILCHFICVYYPQMYKLDWSREDGLSIFASTPLNGMINGNIAVQFFFLLSGFFAAMTIFSGKDSSNLAYRAVKRYLRLLPMIAGASIFAFLLMKAGLLFHLNICKFVNGEFLVDYNNFEPTITSLFYNIFIRPYILNSEYIGPFWYIKPDYWGYLMSLSICILAKGYRWRRMGYVIVLIILWWNDNLSNNSAFIFGILLADIYIYRQRDIFFKVL